RRKCVAPPLCTRRFWNATSATSRSGRSAGRSWILRMPAQSGMVSMSKTRIGVRALFPSVGEHTGRKVAVASIADDRDDDGVLQLASDAQGDVHRATRGDAGEDALLAREPAGGFLRVGLAHVFQPVDACALLDLRQVGLAPLAAARDLRAHVGI